MDGFSRQTGWLGLTLGGGGQIVSTRLPRRESVWRVCSEGRACGSGETELACHFPWAWQLYKV